jgi:hypothetical protein
MNQLVQQSNRLFSGIIEFFSNDNSFFLKFYLFLIYKITGRIVLDYIVFMLFINILIIF